MPAEYIVLGHAPPPFEDCPKCGARPFRPFLRGLVHRYPYTWKTLWLPFGKPRPYCAVICWDCKELVGYE